MTFKSPKKKPPRAKGSGLLLLYNLHIVVFDEVDDSLCGFDIILRTAVENGFHGGFSKRELEYVELCGGEVSQFGDERELDAEDGFVGGNIFAE